jgi:hypothetical protein
MSGERISLSPEVRGSDLFPDVSDEIDRRISHSEQRIKTWVLAGVAANLLVAITAALPMIFYVGQISRDINQATSKQIELEARIAADDKWRNSRLIWNCGQKSHPQRTHLLLQKSRCRNIASIWRFRICWIAAKRYWRRCYRHLGFSWDS